MPLALRARALWKSYAAGVAGCSARVWVLRGATLEVAEGECVAILGAHGSGTSTLLHCLAGLRRADAGTIHHRAIPALTVGRGLTSLLAEPPSDRVLLVDDADGTDCAAVPTITRAHRRAAAGIVLATHELAPVRHLADRVLLLRDGRLSALDRAAGARRVAEPARLTSGMRGRARPGTARA